MGKTALAKLVYNDGRVVAHFDKRMWVCVSDEDFETERLTKKILVAATKKSAPDLPMKELQIQLRTELDDSRDLLLLDDVWNSDRDKWLQLKELLAAVKSRLQPARSRWPPSWLLPPLKNYKFCPSLFLKCAFKDGEGKHHPNLVKVGDEIVKRCGGVPLDP